MFSPGSSKCHGVADAPPTDAGPSLVPARRRGLQWPIFSMRSMPVQNAFSPAPVSTTQRTSSLRRSPATPPSTPRCISEVERVVHLGSVQRDPRDAVALLVPQCLEFGHSAMLRRAQAGVRGHAGCRITGGGAPSACRESRTCPIFRSGRGAQDDAGRGVPSSRPPWGAAADVAAGEASHGNGLAPPAAAVRPASVPGDHRK